MEIPYEFKLAIFSVAIFSVLIWTWRILNYVWFKPKYLEKQLRQQGFKGNSYKFLFGNMKEMKKMGEEALSKPVNFSHDMIWRRVSPFIHQTITNFGSTAVGDGSPRATLRGITRILSTHMGPTDIICGSELILQASFLELSIFADNLLLLLQTWL